MGEEIEETVDFYFLFKIFFILFSIKFLSKIPKVLLEYIVNTLLQTRIHMKINSGCFPTIDNIIF